MQKDIFVDIAIIIQFDIENWGKHLAQCKPLNIMERDSSDTKHMSKSK